MKTLKKWTSGVTAAALTFGALLLPIRAEETTAQTEAGQTEAAQTDAGQTDAEQTVQSNTESENAVLGTTDEVKLNSKYSALEDLDPALVEALKSTFQTKKTQSGKVDVEIKVTPTKDQATNKLDLEGHFVANPDGTARGSFELELEEDNKKNKGHLDLYQVKEGENSVTYISAQTPEQKKIQKATVPLNLNEISELNQELQSQMSDQMIFKKIEQDNDEVEILQLIPVRACLNAIFNSPKFEKQLEESMKENEALISGQQQLNPAVALSAIKSYIGFFDSMLAHTEKSLGETLVLPIKLTYNTHTKMVEEVELDWKDTFQQIVFMFSLLSSQQNELPAIEEFKIKVSDIQQKDQAEEVVVPEDVKAQAEEMNPVEPKTEKETVATETGAVAAETSAEATETTQSN